MRLHSPKTGLEYMQEAARRDHRDGITGLVSSLVGAGRSGRKAHDDVTYVCMYVCMCVNIHIAVNKLRDSSAKMAAKRQHFRVKVRTFGRFRYGECEEGRIE